MRIKMADTERTELVQNIFTRIVHRYDLLNHLLSLGRDVFWRRAAARRIKSFRTKRILDLASGTGDMALTLAEQHHETAVFALDFNYPMLARARDKITDSRYHNRIKVNVGDALHLPFAAQTFDSLTMAFGIRNIPDRVQALNEMLRVLVPGGKAVILELTFPRWSFIRRLYATYLNRLIPWLGGLISGQGQAYQYLADSIMDFPDPARFCRIMSEAGFCRTGFLKLTFGIAVIHWGEKADHRPSRQQPLPKT
jgi:demethylmenaquinone methyltransferase/2-methoxy-6-polyprenyl-1,4-benzoquinol methylase